MLVFELRHQLFHDTAVKHRDTLRLDKIASLYGPLDACD